jgi:hypothetical protein
VAIESFHLQLGDTATWVGSISTSVALILTYTLLRITRQEQRALRADQRADQARKISAWCERVEPSRGDGPDRVTVRLRNASDEPVYAVRVAVGSTWWSEKISYVELELSYVIAPHYDEPHAAAIRIARGADGQPEPSPPVEVIFGDATGGRFWRRDRYGGLGEITGGLPPKGSEHFFAPPANALRRRL